MNWLRVELLRLRSFDWGPGSRSSHWLKDGVAKFSSVYSIRDLAQKLGISEDELLEAIESPSVLNELEGKSFAIHWKGESIVLSWLEEGISEIKTEIKLDYHEEDGKFYQKSRWIERIIYLDGSDRIVKDTGEPKPVRVSKESFDAALEQIRRASAEQET